MFSFVYLILYVPGTLLCSFMFKKYGLRKSFIFSSLLQFFGSILRYISLNSTILSKLNLDNNNTNHHIPYIIAIIGTCFAGLIQPFYTNSPARIAAQWFSVDGRDVATALLSLLNPVGIGLGTFLPTLFIAPVGDKNTMGGYAGYLLVQLICAGVGCLLTILFVKNRPPTPPSASQRMKLEEQGLFLYDNDEYGQKIVNENESRFLDSFKSSFIRIKEDLSGNIIHNKNFLLLCGGFGVGLGFFNVLTTLINQYTAAFGYSSNDAGVFGGLLILGGIFGAIISGAAMELTRKYNEILKVFVAGTVLVAIVFVTQMKENNLVILDVLFGLFGFCAIPIVCVTFECAAECTYPCDEEISSGILMSAGNLIGVVFLVIWGSQLPNSNQSYHNNIWNFSTYFIFVVVGLVCVFFIFYNGEYKRLNQEKTSLASARVTGNSRNNFRQNHDDDGSVVESVTSGHGKLIIDDRKIIM